MIIGSISENKDLEKRISITPDIAKKYISNGFEVLIEKGLGEHIGISDDNFIQEGCKIENQDAILSKSNIILQLNLPEDKNLEKLNENLILIGNFNSNENYQKILNIVKKKYQYFLSNFCQELPELSRWIYYLHKQT